MPENTDCNFSELFSNDYVPDFTKEGETPECLARMFGEVEDTVQDEEALAPYRAEARTDIEISARGQTEYNPSLVDFNIVEVGDKGRLSVNRQELVKYLKACKVVFADGIPYRYSEGYYQELDPEYLKRMIYKAVEMSPRGGMPYPPFMSVSAVNDVIAMLRATSMPVDVQLPAGSDDRYYSDLIPFDNGLYSIEDDELLPFTPNLFITHRLDALYIPSIVEHPVEEVYRGIIPDDDTRRFFFEMVGYTLFSPTMAPPAIFLIYGPGQTGKTALQKAVTAAAGYANVSSMDLNQISDKFSSAELLNKLMNVSGETGSGKKDGQSQVDGELLKRLSDGQPIAVQRKYGQPFEMCNTAKLWFISNTLPDFGDTSSGLYRRLYIIPCRNEQDWDSQIHSKIVEPEAVSWLVNKALRGYKDFIVNGRKFHESKEMKAELKAYKVQNPLMDFMEYRYGTMDKLVIQSKLEGVFINELHADYKQFVETSGGRPMASRKFAELVRNEFGLKTVTERVTNNGLPTNWKKFTRMHTE